ncbi:MAG: amino acid adenylation domain-containing protein [Oscillospiraceae bacterium]|nr:amino acid adenylation domain-containing protein [Oscillospiraceae bacterium]MCL2278588.1 amino acid adenylation domain-containing protein [Oscillospiraceae bacterium]
MINVLEYLENTINNIADPEKKAFVGDDGALSFKQLHTAALSCGSYIAEQNIKRKPIVVHMKKSPEMIAAFLGVVYSGNYYVPLDNEIPAFRIQMILETVNPELIICDETTARPTQASIGDGAPAAPQTTTIDFNQAKAHKIDEQKLQKVRKTAIDTDPLYVVFTSGSTGRPKGVVASHRSVIDYIENLTEVLKTDENTVFGNQSPLYLDACLKEIYPTLKHGATTHIIPQQLFMFPIKLIEYITENKINTVCWVASAFSLVSGLGALEKSLPYTLKTIAFGSEVFPIKHYNNWRTKLPEARFVHLYGPTEATGMSTYYIANSPYAEDESIPIGYPFKNTEIVLLGEDGKTASDGNSGEICIRGAGLSLGYFADEEKTRAAFIQNPLSEFPDIIYKTGDLGRKGKNGELYYISRKDHQIKHMGYRIELAEIELMAARHEKISLACAVFDDTESRIILYYMGKEFKKSEVKAHLKKNLPRYMLPHAIYELEEIPRTPGGKLDRVKLLEMHREH